MSKNIGIFGGTFNPPHIGHLHAAKRANEALQLDEIIFIPTGIPPHKDVPDNTPDNTDRLNMTKIMARDVANSHVSDIEIKRAGKSYTYETVSYLRDKYENDKLWLLMGTDMLTTFLDWKNPDIIVEKCSLCAMSRAEGHENKLQQAAEKIVKKYNAEVIIVSIDPIEISSSEIRQSLENGEKNDKVPDAVFNYVRENHLYNFDERLFAMRNYVKEKLKPSRYNHVLGCEKEAAKLAKRWGENEKKAREAAILHDMTKYVPETKQLNLCKEYGIISNYVESLPACVLHALTGAKEAKKVFDVSCDIENAIRWHTTGKENMTTLEKIIFLADMIEPSRTFEGVEKLRVLAYENLDEALIEAMTYTIEHVDKKRSHVCEDTIKARDYLLSEKNRAGILGGKR